MHYVSDTENIFLKPHSAGTSTSMSFRRHENQKRFILKGKTAEEQKMKQLIRNKTFLYSHYRYR